MQLVYVHPASETGAFYPVSLDNLSTLSYYKYSHRSIVVISKLSQLPGTVWTRLGLKKT